MSDSINWAEVSDSVAAAADEFERHNGSRPSHLIVGPELASQFEQIGIRTYPMQWLESEAAPSQASLWRRRIARAARLARRVNRRSK